jgi:hypothetical protein
VIAIQPQRFDSTLAIAIFISGGHSTKAFMRSWKMPSRAAFDIDILVMAAPEYLDIVSRGRWPQSSRLLSRAGSRDLKRSAQIEFFLKGFGYSQCSGSRGQSILLSVSAGLPLFSLIVVVAIMYRYMVMA